MGDQLTASLSERFFAKDSSLWTSSNEDQFMGWIDLEDVYSRLETDFEWIDKFKKDSSITDIILCGMGGSVVASMSLAELAHQPDIKIHVLDTIEPSSVMRLVESLDMEKTLVGLCSKSGSTLEMWSLCSYFESLIPSDQFFAITDPSTKLEEYAKQQGFLRVFHGEPQIGGRYSVFSAFGYIPLAFMGRQNLEDFYQGAKSRLDSFLENDKLIDGEIEIITDFTFDKKGCVCPLDFQPPYSTLGLWFEQLMAESLGKEGKDIPFPLDMSFWKKKFEIKNDVPQKFYLFDSQSDHLEFEIGGSVNPAIETGIEPGFYGLGSFMFARQVQVAALGHEYELNPFDQPQVELTKKNASHYLGEDAKDKHLNRDEASGLDFIYSGADGSLNEVLRKLLVYSESSFRSLLLYADNSMETNSYLEEFRQRAYARVKKKHFYTGFGPRYLHSIGQFFKGASNRGVYIIVNILSDNDIVIKDNQSFNQIKSSLAFGDYLALKELGRHVLYIQTSQDKLNSFFETLLKNALRR